jgi:hypothetical protein
MMRNKLAALIPSTAIDLDSASLTTFLRMAVVTLLQIALVVALLPVIFENNDDPQMNSIVSGALTGEPLEYIIFSNILIGKMLKFFYELAPTVNWYGRYLIFSFYLGYTALQYAFWKIKGSRRSKIVRHLFIFSLLFFSLVILQFTRIAAVAIIGGGALIVLSQKLKPAELVFALFLILWGGMIRYSVLLMLIVIGLPFLLHMLLQKRFILLGLIGLIFLSAYGLNRYNNSVYKNNPEYQAYRTFVSLSAQIWENNNPDFKFEDQKAAAEKVGWTEADLNAAMNSNLDVGHPKFSQKKLQEFLKRSMSVSEKAEKGLIPSALKNTAGFFAKYLSQTYMLLFYALLVLLLLHFNNHRRVAFVVFLIYIFAVAFYLYFFRNGIPKPRVLFGMITPAFLLALAFLRLETIDKSNLFPARLISPELIKKGILALAILAFIAPVAAYARNAKAIKAEHETARKLYQTLKEQNDEFCAAWIDVRAYEATDLPYSRENIYWLGWTAGSPSNKEKIEEYTGEKGKGIYTIFGKDIIWYFNHYYHGRFGEYIMDFYQTNYPACRTEQNKIPINQSDTLYKLNIFIPEKKANDTIQ